VLEKLSLSVGSGGWALLAVLMVEMELSPEERREEGLYTLSDHLTVLKDHTAVTKSSGPRSPTLGQFSGCASAASSSALLRRA
jgi:hypothetical protein